MDCCSLLANAAVAGDSFSWHVDAGEGPSCLTLLCIPALARMRALLHRLYGSHPLHGGCSCIQPQVQYPASPAARVCADPSGFPDSPWRERHGDYCNREPGQPYFVSLLLYLNAAWPREWDAETLFLDGQTDVGLVVRPCRYVALQRWRQACAGSVRACALLSSHAPTSGGVKWTKAVVCPGSAASCHRRSWAGAPSACHRALTSGVRPGCAPC